ncbi:MAG: PKD domain-containing protein [Thermoplasmata archaeon]|nr:MAG: PKD domain-containing protein [Thermoplasmata archaeon]
MVHMKKVSCIIIICIIVLIALQNVLKAPNVSSDENDIQWEEYVVFKGSCSEGNVRRHFQVNRTVVEIIVNLNWETEGGWADLDMLIEDVEGYVANASSTSQMPEFMRVREFPNRGRWTFVVVPVSCGSSGSANYTANITLRNIILPELEVSATRVESGKNVTLTIITSYENINSYYFDFGDETDSGWLKQSHVTKIYNKSGDYQPKARVRYSDGTESDLVEGETISVKSIGNEPDLLLIAVPYAIILAFITILAYFIFKKRKGV